MWHPGEVALQRRAGVRPAEHGSARVRAEIPTAAAEFLRAQRMIVIGTPDRDGRVWATALTGPPGFVAASGARTIVIGALPTVPPAEIFDTEHDLGTLAIEPMTRRRMRANGRARRDGDRLLLLTDQVYANCSRYLQRREMSGEVPGTARTAQVGAALSAEQQTSIRDADTFFIATHADGLGSDVSHRGGDPGFVQVVDGRRLIFPDYAGNLMYMTLGNLELNPMAGLLFLDWKTGDALHLTGRARVLWDPGNVPGAERLVEFEVDSVLQVAGASPFRWTFVDRSKFNPPAPVP
ncbi:pyridoxamine 5'-phosphate oxidase family protein [Sphaerimonospora sp. CA-214678]|uniref:pyridoxamine 5'-phosphate oxidase family protein n=1 Tax=Sphaerimonospora sp. CA-214678 TaxID=3240029 RepID=UPI003D8BD172